MNILRKIATSLYCLLVLLYSYMIWFKLDLSKMDLSGHMASAAQFARSGMHAFNDRMFLGTTHNLFYPPLEDIIINIIKLLSFQNHIVTFQIYLTLLLIGFVGILLKIGKDLKKSAPYLFYHFTILAILTINKDGTLYLQGMSMDDLIKTGLTNQFLSGIAFFWICNEILKPQKNVERNLVIGTILSLLSHIIVGAVSFGLSLLYFVLNKNSHRKVLPLALIIGMCFFYLGPFLFYKSYMTNSNIFVSQPWIPFFMGLVALGFAFRLKLFEQKIILFLASLLFTTGTIFPVFVYISNLVPSFHYYRFTVVAYYLFIIGLAHLLDVDQLSKWGKYSLTTIGALFFAYLFYVFNPRTNFFEEPYAEHKEVDISQTVLKDEDYGRYLLFSSDRTAGTSMESLLTLNQPGNRFSKGLYWESSYTNIVGSSFLATLLIPPVVLDYFYFYGYSCEIKSCLLDEYFRIYNIKGFIGNFEQLSYIKPKDVSCYKYLLDNGTKKHRFIKNQSFRFDQKEYYVYDLAPKATNISSLTNAVELISPSQIKIENGSLLKTSENIVVERFKSCENPNNHESPTVYLHPKDEAKFQSLQSNIGKVTQSQKGSIKLTKLNDNEYRFTLPPLKSWFVLKLAPQPGMKLLNQAGKEMPHLRGIPYTIGYGSDEVRVVFKRTWIMWLSYLLSLISLCIFVRIYLKII